MFSKIFKESNLRFKNELNENMFNSHVEELKKRILNREHLQIEINQQMYDQIEQHNISLAEQLLSEFTNTKLVNWQGEVFLLATHIMMMEEDDE